MLTGVTDALATADTSQGGSGPSNPCALAFFIKSEYVQTENTDRKGLTRIAVTIQSDEGFPHSPRYLRSLHRSLSSLFQQSGDMKQFCLYFHPRTRVFSGLEPEFVWGDVLEGVKGESDGFTPVEYEYEEGTLQGSLIRENMKRATESKVGGAFQLY